MDDGTSSPQHPYTKERFVLTEEGQQESTPDILALVGPWSNLAILSSSHNNSLLSIFKQTLIFVTKEKLITKLSGYKALPGEDTLLGPRPLAECGDSELNKVILPIYAFRLKDDIGSSTNDCKVIKVQRAKSTERKEKVLGSATLQRAWGMSEGHAEEESGGMGTRQLGLAFSGTRQNQLLPASVWCGGSWAILELL